MDASGNAYITGSFQWKSVFGSTTLTAKYINAVAVYVAKIDPSGQFLWALMAGGNEAETDRGYGIAVDPLGRVSATGFFEGSATFSVTPLYASNPAMFYWKIDKP